MINKKTIVTKDSFKVKKRGTVKFIMINLIRQTQTNTFVVQLSAHNEVHATR